MPPPAGESPRPSPPAHYGCGRSTPGRPHRRRGGAVVGITGTDRRHGRGQRRGLLGVCHRERTPRTAWGRPRLLDLLIGEPSERARSPGGNLVGAGAGAVLGGTRTPRVVSQRARAARFRRGPLYRNAAKSYANYPALAAHKLSPRPSDLPGRCLECSGERCDGLSRRNSAPLSKGETCTPSSGPSSEPPSPAVAPSSPRTSQRGGGVRGRMRREVT